MTTYTEIKRLTGNNKGYAASALNTLIETCWWVEASDIEKHSIIYLRSKNNDWVAIPAPYFDEDDATEFYTVSGATVTPGFNYDTFVYIATVA